jgi:hypothetical protein
MNSKIILDRILQRFVEQGYAQVEGYNHFGYINLKEAVVTVSRENGNETPIPFKKILIAIEGYQMKPEDYNTGPHALRTYGLTHITSPIFSLLHLLPISVYID